MARPGSRNLPRPHNWPINPAGEKKGGSWFFWAGRTKSRESGGAGDAISTKVSALEPRTSSIISPKRGLLVSN